MLLVNDNPPLYYLDNLEFPNPYEKFEFDLAAVSPDLNIDRLLKGYSEGFFPWYEDDDLFFWFMLEKRLFIFVENIRVTKKLAQKLRSPKWEIRYNTNFEEVIRNCSEIERKHESGSWISEDFIDSYIELYKAGFAISVETYFEGELVGGFYGVAINKYFTGESMFSKKSDASKLALIDFADVCKNNGVKFIDCQTESEHLKRMGGTVVEKKEYLKLIKEAVFE